MQFEEYRRHDAVGLAELVARREVSAGELLDVAVGRMAEVNPQINAVTRDLSDRARSEPPGEGPLAGVPYLLKDLGAALAGVPTTLGSRMFAQSTPAA
ncbi:MAG: 6-aminohexanoate-cyclic-dimer hydrolase, partial [Phenylobacterium sp.]|nr:6-aminohexanoate-cyclic-dimer hydrolase [Phenylobacterium sp.]